MVRFINIVNTVDKVVDCIPVASTVKNAGIFLYQRAHKVNKIANPVKTSCKDDIKIHVLSKGDFLTYFSMIPIIGNLVAFVYHIRAAIDNARKKTKGGPPDYLEKATRAYSWGLKKHGYEVAALYLARNPNRPENEMREALRYAAFLGNEEIFKLILNSRSTWPSDSIEEALKFAKNTTIAKIILEKYAHILTDKQAGQVLNSLLHLGNLGPNSYNLIELLLITYPNIDIDEVGRCLEKAAGEKKAFGGIYYGDAFEFVSLLLERCPQIEEKYKAKALEAASIKGCKDNIALLLHNAPNLRETHMDKLLENAAHQGDKVLLQWLLKIYPKHINTASIGKALASATQSPRLYFKYSNDHDELAAWLIRTYPNLSGKDLEGAMERAARLNIPLFKTYLDKFTQLQPENLQKILNNSVFHHIWNPNPISFKVARLIRDKFPKMKEVEPFAGPSIIEMPLSTV